MTNDSTIKVTINSLGYPIEIKHIKNLLEPNNNYSLEREHLGKFFGLSTEKLNEEILQRYVKLSDKNLYVGILPHDNEILESLLMPYKSAKRCFCFAEYLATIELCGHIAEMLANLLILVNPLTIRSQKVDEETTKKLFGSSFEKLNQSRRLDILHGFEILTNSQYEQFKEIKDIRNKYYHLWGNNKENIEKDAFKCFSNVTVLIKGIIEIKINDNPPPQCFINPALKNYLDSKA